MRSAQSGDCVLAPAGARRYETNHRGIEGEHWAQYARVRIERGTHARRASKLGPVERWWTQHAPGNNACIYMSDKNVFICHQDLKRRIYVEQF